VQDTPHGALFTPSLHELPPGLQAPVHSRPLRQPTGRQMAAGGGQAVSGSQRDRRQAPGPAGGDPRRACRRAPSSTGDATLPRRAAPRVKDLKGARHDHAGAGHLPDEPSPGRGGGRIACGTAG
jgi:hypothetical protein